LRVDVHLEGVGAFDGSLVVGEVPHVPELSVHASLKKKMRGGHVLYVFEVGHGCLRGHGLLDGLLCEFDFSQARNTFQFLKWLKAAQEKSRRLFFFIISLILIFIE